MGLWDYVTGIGIVDKDGREQVAGFALSSNEVARDVTELHARRVAIGPGGVRALQVVDESHRPSDWVERTEGVPWSDRLVMTTAVAKISVTLDRYKITALAVTPHDQLHAPHRVQNDLRHTALWYPDTPPEGLLLNEESFAGHDPMVQYQPLAWIHFGGPGGKDLSHVQGIMAQCRYGIYSLQIVFDKANNRHCSPKLGRCREESVSSSPLLPIDGAGGERIDLLVVGLIDNPHENILVPRQVIDCVEIKTNRGRIILIGKRADDLEMQAVSTRDGTTITGLYGHHDGTYGLTSLGVISEQNVNPQDPGTGEIVSLVEYDGQGRLDSGPKTTDFKKYLNILALLMLYKDIKQAGSSESEVGTFYNNFLSQIFALENNFGVELEQEARALKHMGMLFGGPSIRYIRYFKEGDDGPKVKVILCENKRTDGESQTAVWTNALDQVVRCATFIRTERGQDASEILYLTVNVGTYLRFYELPGNSAEAQDWAPAEGREYELANDEEKVWELWHRIRDLIVEP